MDALCYEVYSTYRGFGDGRKKEREEMEGRDGEVGEPFAASRIVGCVRPTYLDSLARSRGNEIDKPEPI